MIYCVVCYLIVFGILLNEYDHLEEWTWNDIICFILAPIVAPIIFGFSLNKKKDEER